MNVPHYYPTCGSCHLEYIPIPHLQNCPWCSGQAERPDPTETYRDRTNRKKREARAAARAAL
jgi:hypothetical protein